MNEFLISILDYLTTFNEFDWLISVISLMSAVFGIYRGLAREALSMIGWVAAFLCANFFAEAVSVLVRELVDDLSLRYLVAWALTFVGILLTFNLIAVFLSEQLKQPGFALSNRLFGGFFGLCRGAVIVAILTAILRAILPDSDEDLIDDAVLIEWTDWMVTWIGISFDQILEFEPGQNR